MEGCGFFGKRPMERDFVTEGLGASLTEKWAGLMSGWLAGARDAEPRAWQRLYFESPSWRFAVPPGLLGGHAWSGILLASADAVGRTFPLSVLLPSRTSRFQFFFDGNAEFALDMLEVHAMAFLEGELTRELFSAKVRDFAQELDQLQRRIPSHGEIPLDADAEALRVSFARAGPEAVYADEALVLPTTRRPVSGTPLSYWWQDGGSSRPPELCVWRGLPDGRGAGGFFSAQWEQCGWRRGHIDPDRILRP